MSEATSNTWNLSDGVQNFRVTINVGVENTEDVLELFGLDEGCHFIFEVVITKKLEKS